MTLSFRVADNGHERSAVSNVMVRRSTLSHPFFEGCVANVIASLPIEAPERLLEGRHEMLISYPFFFSAEDGAADEYNGFVGLDDDSSNDAASENTKLIIDYGTESMALARAH